MEKIKPYITIMIGTTTFDTDNRKSPSGDLGMQAWKWKGSSLKVPNSDTSGCRVLHSDGTADGTALPAFSLPPAWVLVLKLRFAAVTSLRSVEVSGASVASPKEVARKDET